MHRLITFAVLVALLVLIVTGEIGPLFARLAQAIADPIADRITELVES